MIMTDRESMRAAQGSSSRLFILVPPCCPLYVYHAASCRSINHFPPGGLLDPCWPLPFREFSKSNNEVK